MTDAHRGHPIVLYDREWYYDDTGQLVYLNPNRACGYCRGPNTAEGHDACLGTVPGARNACCGHGHTPSAYVQLEDGSRLAGEEALAYFNDTVRPL